MLRKSFDIFITVCIIINSLLLASKNYRDYYDIDFVSVWNEVLEYIDLFFSIIFILECISKIIVMGFAWSKKAYLRDPWNVLDLIIVIISIINFLPSANSEALKSLRGGRVLRPLRSIGTLRSIKRLI